VHYFQGLKGAASIALAINDPKSAAQYQVITANLSSTINKSLWNASLGLFSIATSDSGNFSIAGLAFTITSGVASPSCAQAALSHLHSLALWPGYVDSSIAPSSSPTRNISRNINGFLLESLLRANQTALAKPLIKSLWGAMLANESATTTRARLRAPAGNT
jgi:hypothetical protein